jgi:hypothetical protein
MSLLQLIQRYCESRNLMYPEYLQGLFGGLTIENLPEEFLQKQYRYHLEWMKKTRSE